jgi:beta-galactosidase
MARPVSAADRAAGGRPFWEDPAVQGVNRRAAHAPLRSFPAPAAALEYFTRPPPVSDALAPCPRVARLSGRPWRFALFPRPGDVPRGFEQPGFDARGFGEVRRRAAAGAGWAGAAAPRPPGALAPAPLRPL